MWHFHQKALASFSREYFRAQDWTTIQNKEMELFQGRLHSPQPNSFRTFWKTKYVSCSVDPEQGHDIMIPETNLQLYVGRECEAGTI